MMSGTTGRQFPHVNHSLAPHTVTRGQVAEVALEGEGLWPVKVLTVCGPLLEVSPLGCPALTRWYDSRRGVWPWGEGETRGLTPPSEVLGRCGTAREWYSLLEGEAAPLPRLTTPLAPGAGSCPADSLRPGLKFELQGATAPTEFWGVTVTENWGGMLGLSYDSPELKPSRDFRLFYLSPRLFPCGTVAAGAGRRFVVPACLRAREYPEHVWRQVIQSFCEVTEERAAPSWCFPEAGTGHRHGFQERMLLTVIHPGDRDRLAVAIVDRPPDSETILVSLLEEPGVQLLVRGDSTSLLPISWAIEHGLLDKASLQTMSCSPLSRIGPRSLFPALAREEPGFLPGEHLEFCSSPDNLLFLRAEVEQVRGHILRLRLEGGGGVLCSALGQQIFPTGWCRTNGIELEGGEQEEGVKEEGGEQEECVREAVEASVPALVPEESCWCPAIYFNHHCYSASFLSRHRLESLPRYIGAGPVRLVMREVLSRLIGSSFKSGAVLRKLELGEKKPRPYYWLETMKGKSRVLLLQAEVEIPSRASQVAPFCREVCQKLSCCPYLFGPQLVGEECPSACSSRPKSDFHTVDGDGRRRGARGRKKGRAGEGAATPGAGAQSGQSSSCSSPSASPTPSTAVTTCTTRENSPSAPRQLAGRPSCQEVETLQKILAEKCNQQEDEEEEEEEDSRDASPPPRPPSPKLLRSSSSSLPPALPPPRPPPRPQGELLPAFNLDLDTPCPTYQEPPPVRRVELGSNPLLWSPGEVAAYMEQQEDVKELGRLFLHDQVDGQALLLLNLPSLLDHWKLRLGEGVRLARHIESVKLAFYTQWAFTERRPE